MRGHVDASPMTKSNVSTSASGIDGRAFTPHAAEPTMTSTSHERLMVMLEPLAAIRGSLIPRNVMRAFAAIRSIATLYFYAPLLMTMSHCPLIKAMYSCGKPMTFTDA
jgi:hypothetical protein